MDETETQVLQESGRKATTESRTWVYVGERVDRKNFALFEYSTTRNGDNAVNFLSDYSGYSNCDGCAGYNKLMTVMRCSYLAHIRR